MSVQKKIVVITGASSGIGLAAARLFVAKGEYTVYGLNRSLPQGEIDGSSKDNINYLATDVTDEKSVRQSIVTIISREKKIDILINNAGYGISGPVEFTGLEDAKSQFDVNFFGTFATIKAVLPYMRQVGCGRIINVTSVAGAIPVPFQAFYSASKAALNSLTLALANELRPFGIKVLALMPGNVNTSFPQFRKKSVEGEEVYKALEKSVATMEKEEENGLSPEYIARLLYRISRKRNPKLLYTSALSYKILVVLYKLLPARLVNRIVGILYA